MKYRQITLDLIEALKDQRVTLKSISEKCGFGVPELCLIAQSLAIPKRKRGRKAKVTQ